MKRRTYAAVLIAAATLIPAGSAAAATIPENRFTTTGAVVNCSGSLGDLEATVEVYESSSTTNHLNVVVSGPGGTLVTDRDAPEPEGLFTNGTIQGETPLVRRGEEHEGSTPAGTATVTGSYTVAGSPTRVHEANRDDNYIIVTTGTTTPLEASLSVTLDDGTTIPLTCDTAFAFDLDEVRQPIGNN